MYIYPQDAQHADPSEDSVRKQASVCSLSLSCIVYWQFYLFKMEIDMKKICLK